MDPYKLLCQLLEHFEAEFRNPSNGVSYKCALMLGIEALKRIRPFM
jgi:hypothetical protein